MNFVSQINSNVLAWSQALLVLLLFYPLGIVVRKVVFFYFEKWTKNTENEYDDIIAERSRIHVIIWTFLACVSVAARIAPLEKLTLVYVNKGVFSLFLISITFLVSNVISDLIKTYTKKFSVSAPLTSLTDNLIKIGVMAIGVLIVLSNLGISITPLLTALGVGSLAIALALQDTLSNFISGFLIIANKQTHTGDYIRLDSGQEGYVVDIGWRATRIRQLSNNIILVPNAKLANAIVLNFHMPEKEMSIVIPIGVSYSSDLEKVEKVTIEVMRETLKEVSGGVGSFEPFIRYNAFGDSSINFSAILRVKEFVDQYLVTHEFIKRLHKRYNQEGIEIPFPQRVVHIENPSI